MRHCSHLGCREQDLEESGDHHDARGSDDGEVLKRLRLGDYKFEKLVSTISCEWLMGMCKSVMKSCGAEEQ